mmetsp:Transcript_48426/g.85337  ORF Transcript_48426/g.85337 Transcript_48426/m.85337 type:complete len:358 (-) Transcript_48426:67-1140(-)
MSAQKSRETKISLPEKYASGISSVSGDNPSPRSAAFGSNDKTMKQADQPEEQESLEVLLQHLSKQKVELRQQQERDERRRLRDERRAELAKAGKFIPECKPWLRPCARAHEFEKMKPLGFEYVTRAWAVDRPARTYEPTPDPPFLLGVREVPKHFAKFDALDAPLVKSARAALKVPRKCRSRPPTEKIDETDEVMLKILGKMNERKYRAIDFFRTIDTSGDGLCSVGELRKGLAKMDCLLTYEDFMKVVKRLDDDNSGEVDIKEFDREMKDVEKKARVENRHSEIDTWLQRELAGTGMTASARTGESQPPALEARHARLSGVQASQRTKPTWNVSNAASREFDTYRSLNERLPLTAR